MSDSSFYYESNGQQLGPVSAAELKAKALSGELKPTDMVWKEGLPDWVTAGSVRGLFPEGTVPPQAARPAASGSAGDISRQAAAAARDAAQQSLGAVKILLSDPVGGLGKAYESLGPSKALPVGIVFLVGIFLCHLLTSLLGASMPGVPGMGKFEFKAYAKDLLGVAAMVAAAIGMCAVIRKMNKPGESFVADLFITGASLAPFFAGILVAALLGSILKPGMFFGMISISILIFAFAIMVFLLFSGVTKIYGASERSATLWVPGILIAGINIMLLLANLLN